MEASSSIYPAQTYCSQSWNYDVFLSFRGEDTRKTFVDHLYTALEHQGIYTYKDDETLPRGNSIRPSLMKAIEESQIAVIILSENYADSSWCLDELECIMKCKNIKGQTVMPIFYDVDPSEVRKQKRKYGEAFARHEVENKTNVESWRKALVDVSNLSGWEPKHIANGHESKSIKQIVVEISQKLHPVTSSANEKLIGIEARMQRLRSDLQIGSGGVRMIGIWGVGGGGKTTLASSIYEEISSKFDSCCFVENIREESSRFGLRKLQEKIISEMDVSRVGGGMNLINNRFQHKKVLIVLDDVDRLDQLNALAGSHNWFGEGSRIIITTRDVHLLNAHEVVVHNISLLNDDEAIKLFCKHACRGSTPIKDYKKLSEEVVFYAGGLPLALTVLGSFLCDKNIHEWRSALARLKEIPIDNILETLKISFDGLTRVEKELFLDIACFFRWEDKDKAMEILDACGFHPVIGVKVLIQKALITISESDVFDMHDLVQEMGHHIVRGEHPNNPEKYSRVWKKKDVLKIWATVDATKELDKIEAIKMNFNSELANKQEQCLRLIGAKMKNLRYMELIGDPAKPLLDHFTLRELYCLKLAIGSQKQLWKGCKLLPNLKILELHCLSKLITTPDFDGLPNVERFTLSECECLEEIHPSIGRLERLVFLSIKFCSKFKRFPPISRLKKLETLSFSYCPKLFSVVDNIPDVHLDNSGKEVASYQPCTGFFVTCWMCGCSNLPGVECCLPHNNKNRIGLLRFFHGLQELGLRKLNLSSCQLGDEDIGSGVWELPNLQELNLESNKFSRLSFSQVRLPQLKWLNVTNCYCLVELSELPSSIAVINADGCSSLESFGDVSNCKWLWKVSFHGSYKVHPLYGYKLLDSMLQGNAIEYHFISVGLQPQIRKNFVGRFFRGNTFTIRYPHLKVDSNSVRIRHDRDCTFKLRLPEDWYNDFSGFLIRVVTNDVSLDIDIVIKHEPHEEDSRFELWQESHEAPKPEYIGKGKTHMGYIPFGSLRQTTSMNSSHNIISFSIKSNWTSFAAQLVLRKSKDDTHQTTKATTNSSEFWDKEDHNRKTFEIQQDSESSIKILWRA